MQDKRKPKTGFLFSRLADRAGPGPAAGRIFYSNGGGPVENRNFSPPTGNVTDGSTKNPIQKAGYVEIPGSAAGDSGGNLFKERAMDNQYTKNALFGLMIGGMAGAAAILLFAAQSAKLARAKIRRQGIQWLDRAAGIARQSSAQSRTVAGGRTPGNMTVHIA
jgi:hypothetical protein